MVQVHALPDTPLAALLEPGLLAFLQSLHQRFEAERQQLLADRESLQTAFDKGYVPHVTQAAQEIAEASWQVARIPADLQDRRVEITGPVDRKTVINALNSGASVFMADFEDASCPRWDLLLDGQWNLYQAIRRQLQFTDAARGKTYQLADKTATLLVRPRGWHLNEVHLTVKGQPISGSLFDFGTYLYLNADILLANGSGPYFYLPKLENAKEAALWAKVFAHAETYLGLPQGSIKCTVLIETITAAFAMEEILFSLRQYITGLNAGRWDYLFSVIKKFRQQPAFVLPDRAALHMQQPFMAAYAKRLVQVCHQRGAHAIGGMSAYIPARDATANAEAFAKVKADKEREARLGYDGSWVAHPGLVPVARAVFDQVLGNKPHQKSKQVMGDWQPADLLALPADRSITEGGLRTNVHVALQYLCYWLSGQGAAAIHQLMEDAATAEISRAQLWQWLRHGCRLTDGRLITRSLVEEIIAREVRRLPHLFEGRPDLQRQIPRATRLLLDLVITDTFEAFLTQPAYELLLQDETNILNSTPYENATTN